MKKETMLPSPAIVKPTKLDFLVGTEYFCQENSGNVLFRVLVEKNFHPYEQASSRKLKAKIKKQIVDEIKASGGRFLKRLEKSKGVCQQQHSSLRELAWTELSDEDAMKKVVDSFVYMRKKQGGKKASKRNPQSTVVPPRGDDSDPTPGTAGTVSVPRHLPQSRNASVGIDHSPLRTAQSSNKRAPAKPLEKTVPLAKGTPPKQPQEQQQGKQTHLPTMAEKPSEADALSFPSVPSDIPSVLSNGSQNHLKSFEQWKCQKCGYLHDVERNRCAVCGTSVLARLAEVRSKIEKNVGNLSETRILKPLSPKQLKDRLGRTWQDQTSENDSMSLETSSCKGQSRTQHQRHGGSKGDLLRVNKSTIVNNTTATAREPLPLRPAPPDTISDSELNFTKVFSVFNMNPNESGLRQILDSFGDTHTGVRMLMAYDDETYTDVLYNVGLNVFARANLRDFRVWFKTKYMFAPEEAKPKFSVDTWLEYRESLTRGEADGVSTELTPSGETMAEQNTAPPKHNQQLFKPKQENTQSPYAVALASQKMEILSEGSKSWPDGMMQTIDDGGCSSEEHGHTSFLSVQASDKSRHTPRSRVSDESLSVSFSNGISLMDNCDSTKDMRERMKRGSSAISFGSVSVGGTRRKPHSKKAALSGDAGGAGSSPFEAKGSLRGYSHVDMDNDSISSFSIPSGSAHLALVQHSVLSSSQVPSAKFVPSAVHAELGTDKVSGLTSLGGSNPLDAERLRGAGRLRRLHLPPSSVSPTEEDNDDDTSAVTNNTCNRKLRLENVRSILRKMRASPSNPRLQIHSCGELSHFLWDKGGNVPDKVITEIATVVAPMIRDYAEDPDVLTAVLELTASLCDNEKGIEVIAMDLEGLVLSMLVFPESPKVQKLASGVLCSLVQSPSKRATAVNAGGIPILVSALQWAGCDEEVMKQCCSAFLALGIGKNNLKRMVKEGVIEAVVSGLDHNIEDEKAQELGTQVLVKLVALGEHDRLIQTNGLACVVRSMEEHSENQQIQISCCRIISHLPIDETSNKQLIKGNGICSVLRLLQVQRQTPDTKEFVLGALMSILAHVGANRQWVVDAGGHLAILDALDPHVSSGPIAFLGCRALRYCFTGTTTNNAKNKIDRFEDKWKQQLGLNRDVSAQESIGIISRLMRQHQSLDTVQADGCYVLGTVTKWSSGRELLTNEEGVAAVLGALKHSYSHPDVAEHAPRALCCVLGLNCALDRSSFQSITHWSQQSNGFSALDDLVNRHPTLVACIAIKWMQLHSSKKGVQQSGCKMLANLAVDLVVCESIIAYEGITAVLTSMDLHSSDIMIQVEGCRLLSQLAANGGELITAANGIPAILSLMERHSSNAELTLTACKVLSALAQDSDAIKAIPLLGGIPIVVSMMERHSSNKEAIQTGCLTLLRLTPEKENIKLILRSNCVRAVVSKMELHLFTPKIQASGCLLLSRLVLCEKDATRQIGAANGISTVVAAMHQHATHRGLHKIGCLLLELLAEDEESRTAIVEADGISAIMQTLKQKPSEQRLFEEGYSALCKLAQADADECRSIAPFLVSWIEGRQSGGGVEDEFRTLLDLSDALDSTSRKLISCIVVGWMKHHKSIPRIQNDGLQALAKLAGH